MAGASHLKPSSFAGSDNENPRSFMNQFESYLFVNDITDDKVKIHSLMLMIMPAGRCELWKNSLQLGENSTFDAVKQSFLNYFAPEAINYGDLISLYKLRQNGTDPVNYASNVIDRGLKINLSEDQIMNHIIAGADPEVHRFLLARNPGSLNELLSAMRNARTVSNSAQLNVLGAPGNNGELEDLRRQVQACVNTVTAGSYDPDPQKE